MVLRLREEQMCARGSIQYGAVDRTTMGRIRRLSGHLYHVVLREHGMRPAGAARDISTTTFRLRRWKRYGQHARTGDGAVRSYLSLIARYYNYTRDRALLAKHREKIEATAALLASCTMQRCSFRLRIRIRVIMDGANRFLPDARSFDWWKPYFPTAPLRCAVGAMWRDVAERELQRRRSAGRLVVATQQQLQAR